MSTVYENLLAIINPGENVKVTKKYTSIAGVALEFKSGIITIRVGAWRTETGRPYVSIAPTNIAVFHQVLYSTGVSLMLARFGLGYVTKSKKANATTEYWSKGKPFSFVKDMVVDLNSGDPVNVAALEDIKVDPKARNALLKEIRSKADAARMFLRLADTQVTPENRRKYHGATPAQFLKAVRSGDTDILAHTPFFSNGSYVRTRINLFERYDTDLNKYIARNRAALYQAAKILVTGESP